jgi:hypothetical protein
MATNPGFDPISRRCGLAVAATLTFAFTPALTAAAMPEPGVQQSAAGQQRNLEDFIHYVVIGRGDLAGAAATALLDSGITDSELADLVDESGLAERLDRALVSGRRLQGTVSQVAELRSRLQRGRFDLATDPARIQQAVGMLTGTVRGRMMARDRLAQAGPYAVRPLLEVIVNGEDPVLLGEVETVIGQRLGGTAVQPLAAALLDLEPTAATRVIAVLQTIGAPAARPAAPVLAELAVSSSDPRTAAAAAAALGRVMGVEFEDGATPPPAALYTALAGRFLALDEALVSLPPLQSLADVSTLDVWSYDTFGGLEPTAVPKSIWFDVMAMRCARQALALDPSDRKALATFVAADLRRTIAMERGGVSDPIHGDARYSADFFATAAGASIGQEVLAMAIDMQDTPLVRRAIEVLSQIAGADSLVSGPSSGALQSALTYPSRRVRLESALALAASRPGSGFNGDDLVVQTLASAVRTDAALVAVVAADAEVRRAVASAVAGGGMTVLASGGAFDEVEPAILAQNGVDLIVVRGNGDAIAAAATAVRGRSVTSSTPMIAVTPALDAERVRDALKDDVAHAVLLPSADSEFAAEAGRFLEAMLGSPMTEDEARTYAVLALEALRGLAMSGSGVFDVADAERPLLDALDSTSGGLRIMVAEVLAMIDSADAQRAIVDAALTAMDGEQVDLLDQAAASARRFGNRTDATQASALAGLIQGASGDVADAAGRLYGALDLPVAETVNWILD